MFYLKFRSTLAELCLSFPSQIFISRSIRPWTIYLSANERNTNIVLRARRFLLLVYFEISFYMRYVVVRLVEENLLELRKHKTVVTFIYRTFLYSCFSAVCKPRNSVFTCLKRYSSHLTRVDGNLNCKCLGRNCIVFDLIFTVILLVDGLSQAPVGSYKDIDGKIEQGTKNRTVASTNMNATSRSDSFYTTVLLLSIAFFVW